MLNTSPEWRGVFVSLQQLSAAAGAPGGWHIDWEVANAGAAPFEIGNIWLPHGRFRSEEMAFTPPLLVEPAATVRISSEVRFAEPPGSVVENGFVILTLLAAGQRWQAFARLRITAGQHGEPRAEVELITSQREGSLPATLEP